MDILIDFDGTCVAHEFPKVGKDIGAVPVLKELVENGHNLILFTMRSDVENPQSDDDTIMCELGNYLTDAVNWFKDNEIPLYGIQRNPTQHTWTTSPKAYGHLMIDDSALGCPLIRAEVNEYGCVRCLDKPHVDWEGVRNMLISKGIISDRFRSRACLMTQW